MEILLTGGSGYIGKSLRSALTEHRISAPSHAELDVSDRRAVDDYFRGKQFDAVVHSAVIGGHRQRPDPDDTVAKNLAMYENLARHQSAFRRLLHFGSGAELFPTTQYGKSKALIATAMQNQENQVNIRIFAAFDENELETRFIKSNIRKYLARQPMTISQDKRMDFFFMADLVSLVRAELLAPVPRKTIECTYERSETLLTIASFINQLGHYEVPIELASPEPARDYIGSPGTFPFRPVGLHDGIRHVYRKLSA